MPHEKNILCLHQSAELYGSDRSFFSAVSGLVSAGYVPQVVLPFTGPLAKLFHTEAISTQFYPYGILRKNGLKKPFSYTLELIRSFFFYLILFGKFRCIYINTVVMLAPLVAAIFYRFSSKSIVCHVREIPGKWLLRFFKILFRLSNVKLIYNSNATRDAFGLSGTVIYNGVSEPESGSPSTRDDKSHLLLIGRINTWKGQLLLLQALAGLPREILSQIVVKIVGSPFTGYEYLLEDIRSFIAQNQLAACVTLHDFVADPADMYRWADYVLVPSIKPEPFGRVAIEAFSYAKPVIAAGHGGLPEIVTDSLNGRLFPPSDVHALSNILLALPSVMSDEYKKLSAAAYQTYQNHFSEHAYKNSIISYFDGLMKR